MPVPAAAWPPAKVLFFPPPPPATARQPRPSRMPACAPCTLPPAAWQHCPGGGGFGVHHHHHRHHHHQQPLTLAAAVDAALAGDPWADGLDLVAGGSCCDDSSPLGLPLTDPGLEALLAPFQDWPDLLLQPAGSTAELPLAAAPPAAPPALLHPQQQRHEQQHQQAAAASPTAAAAAAAAAAPRSASTSTRRSASAAPAISSDGSDGASGSAAPRRHGGRPRKQPGAAPAAARRPPASATAAAGAPPATARPFKQSGRTPKPKYVFQTVEEAADARRERNRKAALESYYRWVGRGRLGATKRGRWPGQGCAAPRLGLLAPPCTAFTLARPLPSCSPPAARRSTRSACRRQRTSCWRRTRRCSSCWGACGAQVGSEAWGRERGLCSMRDAVHAAWGAAVGTQRRGACRRQRHDGSQRRSAPLCLLTSRPAPAHPHPPTTHTHTHAHHHSSTHRPLPPDGGQRRRH